MSILGSIGKLVLGVVGAVAGFWIAFATVPFTGALIGAAIGLTVGSVLFPPQVEQPHYEPRNLELQTSQYGIPITVLYGTEKVAGNLIWYGNFQTINHDNSPPTYTVGLAFGICMGPARVLRMWANKDEIEWTACSQTSYTDGITTYKDSKGNTKARVYHGNHTTGSSYINTYIGIGRNPIWKNLCWIEFIDYELGYTSTPPNFTFEVTTDSGYLDSITNTYDDIVLGRFGDGEVDSVNGYVYFAFRYANAPSNESVIVKININTFTVEDAIEVTDDSFYRTAIDTTNGYLYVTSATPYNRLYKVDLNAFAIVDTLDFTVGTPAVTGIDIDVDSQLAYVSGSGGASAQNFFAIIDLSTFTISGYASGHSEAFYGSSPEIVVYPEQNRVYIAMTHNSGNAFKIWSYEADTGNFVDASDVIGYYLTNASHMVLDKTRDLLYISKSHGGNSAGIHSIDISDPNSIVANDYLELDGGGAQAKGLRLDADDSYLYAWWVDNGLIKIDLDCFQITEQINDSSLGIYYSPVMSAMDLTANQVYFGGSAAFYKLSAPVTDHLPANISRDILTNSLYGLGMSDTLLNNADFVATNTYCSDNDLKISLVFNSQISILDALSYIIQHHNGFIKYSSGLISHGQIKSETPVATLTAADLIQEEGKYPISIVKAGGRDYNNKIKVQYTKRDKEYVIGTAQVDDMADIDTYGLKDVTVKLDGFMTHARASKMANVLLKKSIAQPEQISFKVGPKTHGIAPGDVYAITESGVELSAKNIRIQTVSETNDNQIAVSAIEDVDTYTLKVTGGDVSTQPTLPNQFAAASSSLGNMAVELPPRYGVRDRKEVAILYSLSTGFQARGASIYRSYSSSAGFQTIGDSFQLGLTGVVDAVGDSGPTNYIDVVLQRDSTVPSFADVDSFFSAPNQNLIIAETTAGDVFLRYQSASTVGTGTVRLSGLIYDTVGIPLLNTYGLVSTGQQIGFYQYVNLVNNVDNDANRTIYYKVTPRNAFGVYIDLSDVTEFHEYIDNLEQTPRPIYNPTVNGFGLSSTSIKVAAGDVALTWQSANRFNAGADDYTRTDAITDDDELDTFEIEVYDSTSLIRSTNTTAKTFTYTTAMQSTDGASTAIKIKIRQRNLDHGYFYGDYAEFTVNTV